MPASFRPTDTRNCLCQVNRKLQQRSEISMSLAYTSALARMPMRSAGRPSARIAAEMRSSSALYTIFLTMSGSKNRIFAAK